MRNWGRGREDVDHEVGACWDGGLEESVQIGGCRIQFAWEGTAGNPGGSCGYGQALLEDTGVFGMGSTDTNVDDMDVDLDKEFLQGLKELKVLIADKDLLDLHKSLVCTALRGKISVFSEMEANFKVGPAGSQAQSLNPGTPPFVPTTSLF
ncbi:hypothetical protein L345_16344, partial [Ophiophagus hannah]